ncbi:VOC family protein [Serpens gallinarum]|uniref:VOC family protein n=1 Tax=Serpens gallinarum TaxID=2763075 RepID=A0ABR8TRQ8_9PSED|nr:VOC family protein [Serpens gallinarum]MBD7977984.1 VOC family protein [Serpens gallinarum]
MASENRFRFTGVECIKFAVENVDDAVRFATDWGLTPVASVDPEVRIFRSVDGSEVHVAQADEARADRRPVGGGSGMCEVVWGVEDRASLLALAEELGSDRRAEFDAEGVLHSVDDLGINLAFRLAQRRSAVYEATRFNSPGRPDRINRRAPRCEAAKPHEISHLAIGVDDAGQAVQFYLKRLGFIVSDRYANRGVFLRCSPSGNHHHVFFMNAKVPGTRFNHLAFKVRDIHEVIGGGQHLESLGWKTFAGPGRHIISSACFWYFQSPFGGAWEYAADEDVVTTEWESQDFAATSHIFTEWTFGLEKSDGTLKGPISGSKDKTL